MQPTVRFWAGDSSVLIADKRFADKFYDECCVAFVLNLDIDFLLGRAKTGYGICGMVACRSALLKLRMDRCHGVVSSVNCQRGAVDSFFDGRRSSKGRLLYFTYPYVPISSIKST